MRKKLLTISILGILICGGTIHAISQILSGYIGTPLGDGEFRSDGTGNAGEVILSGSYIVNDLLGGQFWIQTVGTGVFNLGSRIEYTGTGNPTLDCWRVFGTASSVNAGEIELSGTNSMLVFNPVSRRLEGYGWNRGVGRIPFGDGTCVLDPTEDAAFIGRVKVIGNMGGTSIFSTFYDLYSTNFNVNIFNRSLQKIRKNVGLMVRNLSGEQMNATFSTVNTVLGNIFYYNSSPINRSVNYSQFDTVYQSIGIRGLVIIGGDLYIDENIRNFTQRPKSIIVLKNENGVGGNIYIHRDVQRIQAVIFAEGTVYSGEDPTNIYNDTSIELTTLPPRQLYIQGLLLSRNTIGGASESRTEALCPYDIECSFVGAIKYDLNYLRVHDTTDITNRAYVLPDGTSDARYDDYSVIIEYDSRVVSDPPPGFE